MKNSRLIMLEGLPGTGKSTNSYMLYMQLIRNGNKVRWIHEVALPHPTLFFSEACFSKEEYQVFLEKYPTVSDILNSMAEFRATTVGIDFVSVLRKCPNQEDEPWYKELITYDVDKFSLERYEYVALEKWDYFVERVLQEDNTIYILDSSIIQFQVFWFLLKDAGYLRLASFVEKIINLLKPLNPTLIYLYRESMEDAISFLKVRRGIASMEAIWERDKNELYYQKRQTDVTAYFDFLRDYANFATKLVHDMDCSKLIIEISKQNWKNYEKEMLQFLEIEYKEAPTYCAPEGIYINPDHNFEFTIKENMIIDPEGTKRKLTSKNQTEFFIECLPMVLNFFEENLVKLSEQQIIPHWTETGMIYIKK